MKKSLTLIELIISIIIITVCAIPLAVMYQESAVNSYDVRTSTVASNLVENKTEEILNLGFSGVSDIAQTGFSAPFADYTYEVDACYVDSSDLNTCVDPITTDYKRIEIIVEHNGIQKAQTESLLTDY